MTKEEFLKGKSFKLNLPYISKGVTYSSGDNGSYIREEYRGKDNKVLFSKHLMNIEHIGTKRIKCFTFILATKVSKTIYYKDMIEVPEEDNI